MSKDARENNDEGADENPGDELTLSQGDGESEPIDRYPAADASNQPGTYEVVADAKFVPLIGRPLYVIGAPVTGDSPIEALELQPRTYNCLTRAELRRVADVASLTDEHLLALRNFSAECLADLRQRLRGVQD